MDKDERLGQLYAKDTQKDLRPMTRYQRYRLLVRWETGRIWDAMSSWLHSLFLELWRNAGTMADPESYGWGDEK